ncbi:MAG: amino acid adenylation domain-containing protein, partial [Candidatus Scalindua sp.]|nr:amino acid adenylation domain-containing protein [Candidatus Scalindua sp.]
GEIPVLDLPADFPRPAVQSFEGDRVNFTINKEDTHSFKRLAGANGVSTFMGLVAMVKTVIYRYTGQNDIIVGTPIAGRQHKDLDGQIGFYVNTLALRDDVKGEEPFSMLLKKVKETVTAGFDNQIYPFDLLVEELEVKRDMSRSPLFDVMVTMQNKEEVEFHLPGVNITPVEIDYHISKFDLTFSFIEIGEEIFCSIEYNTALYKEDRIKRTVSHFMTLLHSVISNPETSIDSMNILPEEERHKLIYEFNESKADYPKEKTISELFEEQVARTPADIAVEFEEKELTYKELNEQANQVAHYLRVQYQIKPDDLVGVMMDRSERMIVALLGILKAGGAYVPLDPEYPEKRIRYMLEDSGCKVLITQSELQTRLVPIVPSTDVPSYGAGNHELIIINIETALTSHSPIVNLQSSIVNPHHLAYVIYTSGSTGKPKGVMVTHRNIVSFHLNLKKTFFLKSSDTILGLTTICFDISMLELICSLLSGMKVVITPDNISSVPEELVKVVTDNRVSVLQITPSRLKLVIESVGIESLLSVRVLLIGGEELPQHLFEQLKPLISTDIYNVYGPTETTVWSCSKRLNDGILTIGTPLLNEEIYILSEESVLLPTGVKGEICIGGTCVSRGYWQDPVMTTEKFVPHPFRKGERLYKTGDLGRWLPGGDIEFLGRKDDQVKVRGYRIECGEVEQTLLKHPDIKEAVVVAVPKKEEMKELAAHLVCGEEITASELRDHVSRFLPEYMIPSWFIPLEQVPLTPNGKIDRKALPAPDGMEISTGIEYVAPRDELERQLAAVW